MTPTAEFKLVPLRETAAPHTRPLGDTPDAIADYWRAQVETSPNYSHTTEQAAVIMLNTRRRITGHVIASSGVYQQWAAAVLPLGRRLFEVDFHIDKMRALQRKYGSKVDVVWHHDDDWFTLASLDENLTVEDLQKEFGLTPLDDYRVRATLAVDAARTRAAGKAQ